MFNIIFTILAGMGGILAFFIVWILIENSVGYLTGRKKQDERIDTQNRRVRVLIESVELLSQRVKNLETLEEVKAKRQAKKLGI